MAVEGGTKIIKYLVLFFNLLFFIFGIILVAIGGWAEAKYGSYLALSNIEYASGSRLLIAVGVIIAVVAFCGCCGAYKENKCLLMIFFALLLIILILEITSAALAYQHKDKVMATLQKDINSTIATKYGSDKGTTDLIDLLQQKEKCCGGISYRDWTMNPKFNVSKVPDSCCITKTSGCGSTFDSSTPTNAAKTIYTMGCETKLKELITSKLNVIAGMAIAILVIQLLGMIFALCLICRMDKGESV
ncbi:CD63 antigen [Nematostella vectensis]|uniref:CD63 antigen n=1 Tax=Nematostella vectensis TaxID=45351 RepID=UPI0020770272|nr:CD63 antigen [Nematostella vectensis]